MSERYLSMMDLQSAALKTERKVDWALARGMLPYDDMDIECIAICEAINLIPGVRTIESCCGHNERIFKIWFKVNDLEQLPNLLYWVDPCHSPIEAGSWRVVVETDCGKQYPTFCLEGPIGAFEQADILAEKIADDNWFDQTDD